MVYGLGGADYLNGGPGVDRFSCGAGRDSVAPSGTSSSRRTVRS